MCIYNLTMIEKIILVTLIHRMIILNVISKFLPFDDKLFFFYVKGI